MNQSDGRKFIAVHTSAGLVPNVNSFTSDCGIHGWYKPSPRIAPFEVLSNAKVCHGKYIVLSSVSIAFVAKPVMAGGGVNVDI